MSISVTSGSYGSPVGFPKNTSVKLSLPIGGNPLCVNIPVFSPILNFAIGCINSKYLLSIP